MLTWSIWPSCPQLSPSSFSRARLARPIRLFLVRNGSPLIAHTMTKLWKTLLCMTWYCRNGKHQTCHCQVIYRTQWEQETLDFGIGVCDQHDVVKVSYLSLVEFLWRSTGTDHVSNLHPPRLCIGPLVGLHHVVILHHQCLAFPLACSQTWTTCWLCGHLICWNLKWWSFYLFQRKNAKLVRTISTWTHKLVHSYLGWVTHIWQHCWHFDETVDSLFTCQLEFMSPIAIMWNVVKL